MRRPSVFAGCLDCSVGIYITAVLNALLIGFYYALAGAEAMQVLNVVWHLGVFYTVICICGICFSCAAFTARFIRRTDYRSVCYVRLVSGILSIGFGILVTIFLLAAANPVSSWILGSSAPQSDLNLLALCLRLLSPSAVLLSGVCWLRGFYQGMNENKIDGRSQIIQCVSFYLFAAVISLILIHGCKLNRVYTVCALCGASSLSLLLTGGYYMLFDRLKYPKVQAQAKAQIIPAMKKKQVFHDLFFFCLPGCVEGCLIAAIPLVQMLASVRLLEFCNLKYLVAKQIMAVGGLMCPMLSVTVIVFAFLMKDKYFGVITDASQRAKRSQRIEQMISEFLYYALPVSFTFGCLATEIFQIVYGSALGTYGSLALIFTAVQGFLAAFTILMELLLTVLGYSRQGCGYAFLGLVFRIVTMYFLTMKTGWIGLHISALIGYTVILFLSTAKISNRLGLDYVRSLIVALRTLIACMSMNGAYALIRLAGSTFLSSDRMMTVLLTAAMLAGGILIYLFVTSFMHVRSFFDSGEKKQ